MLKDLEGATHRVHPEPDDLNIAMHNQWFLSVGHLLFDTQKVTVQDFLTALDIELRPGKRLRIDIMNF